MADQLELAQDIVDAAMAYCAALEANAAAAPTEWLPALSRLDAALHDLQLACGYDPCGDDCPGFIAQTSRGDVPGAPK